MLRKLETKIPPVALTLLLAIAAWSISRVVPSTTYAFAGQLALAGILVIAGGAVSLLGVLAFKSHRTTVNPTTPESTSQVVTSGVYHYTRNPMYVGFGLFLLAMVVYLGNIASSLVIPAYVGYMNRFQIKPEERALMQKFGEPFAKYMANVGRWL